MRYQQIKSIKSASKLSQNGLLYLVELIVMGSGGVGRGEGGWMHTRDTQRYGKCGGY